MMYLCTFVANYAFFGLILLPQKLWLVIFLDKYQVLVQLQISMVVYVKLTRIRATKTVKEGSYPNASPLAA